MQGILFSTQTITIKLDDGDGRLYFMKKTIRKPDFFIVGAPKCGTTAMAYYLEQHPDIFMPAAKDSHFWGSDISLLHRINQPPDLFRVDEKTYLSWFWGREEKRVGEASILYLYSKKAAIEINRFNPSADIIVMLRNPVDMIRSLHNHCVFHRWIDFDL